MRLEVDPKYDYSMPRVWGGTLEEYNVGGRGAKHVVSCGRVWLEVEPRGARSSAWTLKEALAVPRVDRASSGSVVQGEKDQALAVASPPPTSTRSTKYYEYEEVHWRRAGAKIGIPSIALENTKYV